MTRKPGLNSTGCSLFPASSNHDYRRQQGEKSLQPRPASEFWISGHLTYTYKNWYYLFRISLTRMAYVDVRLNRPYEFSHDIRRSFGSSFSRRTNSASRTRILRSDNRAEKSD
ncbi:unnamed protein product [Nesidiocoris tenuis]|uniref:Uncharacterized protein n=1 Tax=Nesidiocoris tenuis TaxID=355587 RepID=A0A6H5GC96_9HEMI|nr:unnamed protein product [Nesidiocoris tenuis]